LEDSNFIFSSIQSFTGLKFEVIDCSSVSGGCINQCFRVRTDISKTFFVKQNEKSFFPFFETEALALKEINESQTIIVPKPIHWDKSPCTSFLVLEFIEEGSSNDTDGQRKMGEQLAAMHLVKKPFFGWTKDNCIGATPQPNPRSDDWITFYRESRLGHQISLAKQKGKKFSGAKKLMENLEFFFENYTPNPSLLHGDLWGGNKSFTKDGSPFIFDPATYYGDRETDLAFTYMFGGFSHAFYQGYQTVYPLDEGFSQRKTLYNLYHELNHFNLFGGGYANSAQSSINKLLNQIF
tara:strand:- start:1480 stop:2361 length:882 start_codon:yes stop_codon:yes gene_type:complete